MFSHCGPCRQTTSYIGNIFETCLLLELFFGHHLSVEPELDLPVGINPVGIDDGWSVFSMELTVDGMENASRGLGRLTVEEMPTKIPPIILECDHFVPPSVCHRAVAFDSMQFLSFIFGKLLKLDCVYRFFRRLSDVKIKTSLIIFGKSLKTVDCNGECKSIE
jgi:hypothetical protein